MDYGAPMLRALRGVAVLQVVTTAGIRAVTVNANAQGYCCGVLVGSYAVLLPITFCLTPAGLCGSKEFSRDYAWNRAVGATGRHRLFGMPFEQWLVAAPAPLRSVRTCRLLRLLSLPARLTPCEADRASRRPELRAWGGLVLGLRD